MTGKRYTKYFYLPRFLTASFEYAKVVAYNSKVQFATLDNIYEAKALTQMLSQNRTDGHGFVYVGASTTVGKSLTEWFWAENGKKVDFAIEWNGGEPNNVNELCLSLGPGSTYKFNDIGCNNLLKFVAQKVIYEF